MHKKSVRMFVVFLAGCIVSGLVGAAVIHSLYQGRISEASGGRLATVAGSANVAEVAGKVSPSVVSIATIGNGARSSGAGTGIIVSDDGYVVTNKHVVSGSSAIAVTLHDGTIHDSVKLVGEDPLNDVAFLKIDNARDLRSAKVGNSSEIKIGEPVVAIGNTLGEYKNTVTSGIVSGLGRPIEAGSRSSGAVESLNDLIQTDAAINPGNSGGPLVNINGEVIGINTAIVSDAQGIGFAIPINAVKGMMKTLTESGEAKRAYLGVKYADITPTLVKQKNLPINKGALVLDGGVESGGPADLAGIEPGDIIVKVGDLRVGEHGSVSSLIANYAPGDLIKITVARGDDELNLEVRLVEYKSSSSGASRYARPMSDLFDF